VNKPAGWAAFLDQAMKAKGLTQAQLAADSGIGDAVISRWLNKGNQPDIANLRRLVKPLGLSLLELLVAAGHIEPIEAKMRDKPKPPEPVRRGVSTDGLNPQQERELENYAAYLRSQNPEAKK
jgi:transcriptional regulator with XRE-family HTH domain